MKLRVLRFVSLVVALALLAAAVPVTTAQDSGPFDGTTGGSSQANAAPAVTLASSGPLAQFTSILAGGYVAAGTGMRNRGYGTITLSGIPDGATVVAAYLYWDILGSSTTPDPSFELGQFDGNSITGVPVASGADPCWGNAANFSYRADVTQYVSGNGDYDLAGFASGLTNGQDPWPPVVPPPAPMSEGASLVVVYDSPTSPATQVTIFEGASETHGAILTEVIDGSPPFLAGGTVVTTFIGADGQDSGATEPGSTFNGNALPSVGWDGNDPQVGGNYSNGNLWDTMSVDVTAFVNPGDTSATATVQGGPDCLVWAAQVIGIASPLLSIDIKPGSFPNSINPASKGTIPVAILSTPTFDAPSMLDLTSLTFGRTGDEQSLAFCNPSPEDVNGDGLLDQVCHFRTALTGFQAGDTVGILKGVTVSGTPVKGYDSVRIVPTG